MESKFIEINEENLDMHYAFAFNKRRNRKSIEFLDISCAFDIECSTIVQGDKDNDSWAFMYHWQFGFYDFVKNEIRAFRGRTWQEFTDFLSILQKVNRLNRSRRLVIYVHNLAYEFQFMRNFVNIEESFFRKPKKPLYFLTEYGIEFRCSYMLSNMSLSKFCKNTPGVKHGKLKGDLDYRIVRTPETVLNKKELNYCYHDVAGLCECIEHYRKEWTIAHMPLTSTGFVRYDFRKNMKTQANRVWFENMEITEEQYTILRKCFQGGVTHANRFYVGQIEEDIFSIDFKSSYPARELLDEFPCGRYIEVYDPTMEFLDRIVSENFCYIGEFYIDNFKTRHPFPYIACAKCEGDTGVNDNGRLLDGKSVKMYLTDVDIQIIREIYDEYDIIPVKVFYCRKQRLPKEFRETLLHYYRLKCDLPKDSYEYMKSKNKLNSSYGMSVTDPVQTEWIYEDFEWRENEVNVVEKLSKFFKSRNNFLAYQIGVYVTAYARRELYYFLNKFKNNALYCDTDSVKFLKFKGYEKIISEYNKNIAKQFENYDLEIPYPEKGYLGQMEDDGHYFRFCTLGSKKYAYENDEAEEGFQIGEHLFFHITVSGIPKVPGARAIGSIEQFKRLGVTYRNIEKNKVIYNNWKEIREVEVNGCKFQTGANIAIVDGEYKMGVSREYWKVLKKIHGSDVILAELFGISYD